MVGLRFLLDSNVLSEPVRPRPSASVLAHLQRERSAAAVPSVVWHELTFGVQRLAKGKRRTALETYLEQGVRSVFPILAYDQRAADWHARQRARLRGKGRPAPFVDGQIAAIAAVNDLVLVTANTKDFERFEGLQLVDWSKAGA